MLLKIYSTANKFYYLEINPEGMFHFYAKRCNYQIEKNIAQTFIRNQQNATKTLILGNV